MSPRRIAVFFYGLFMDPDVLRAQGVTPVNPRRAWVEDLELVIGQRATLFPARGARSYGMLMDLTHQDLVTLYAGADLQAYRPEAVLAHAFDSDGIPALCYNLVERPRTGERNAAYAEKLRAVLTKLELPEQYVRSIG